MEGESLQVLSGSVLLVDDNELLLSNMNRFLKKDFHHVTAVCTGEEAIMHVEGRFYHIIVLDINLPDLNGWQVLEQIKRQSPNSKVIMITCNDNEDMRENAVKRGATDYLEKPFGLGELKNLLVKILSHFDMDTRLRKTYQVVVGDNYQGFTYSISPTCMFIITDVLFEQGSTVDILLHIPRKGHVALKGRVVSVKDSTCQFMPSLLNGQWRNGEMQYGVGVELVDQPPSYTSFVNALLS